MQVTTQVKRGKRAKQSEGEIPRTERPVWLRSGRKDTSSPCPSIWEPMHAVISFHRLRTVSAQGGFYFGCSQKRGVKFCHIFLTYTATGHKTQSYPSLLDSRRPFLAAAFGCKLRSIQSKTMVQAPNPAAPPSLAPRQPSPVRHAGKTLMLPNKTAGSA